MSFNIMLVIGICLLVTSFFIALREILLRPEFAWYPRAPFGVRSALFLRVVALFFTGTVVIFSASTGVAIDWPDILVVPIGAGMFEAAVLLLNILRQRYSARFWRRVDRLLVLAECDKGQRLALLESFGFRVFAPGERATSETLAREV